MMEPMDQLLDRMNSEGAVHQGCGVEFGRECQSEECERRHWDYIHWLERRRKGEQ